MPLDDLATDLSRLLPPETRTIVRVDTDGWALIEHRSTGRLLQRTMRAGEAEYTADVPEVVPHQVGTAATLAALADAHAYQRATAGRSWSKWQREQEQQSAALRRRDKALGKRLTPLLTDRVLSAAQTADPVPPTGRIPCRNCSGSGGGTSNHCWCKDNGLHYLGVVADPDDLITDEPSGTRVSPDPDAAPVYDPDCDRCHGTGTTTWTCQPCQGTGTWPACIDWVITGPDGTLTVRRDAAALLRDGDALLDVTVGSRNRLLDVRVRLDLTPLLDRINAVVASGQPTWVRYRRHFDDWAQTSSAAGVTLEMKPAGTRAPGPFRGHAPLFAADGPFQYRPWDSTRSLDVRAGSRRWVHADNADRLLPTGEALLAELQAGLTDQPYAQPGDLTGYTVAPDGLIEAFPMTAVVKIPGDALLDDMITTASSHGLALGLSYGFIATGQTGPQVYLMAGDQALAEIGLSHTWQGALAEAHAVLPSMIARARKAGFGKDPA